CLQYDEFPFTF
nr:immunoglobulin light chain junction region [Mus musculus]NSL98143.1 immunoglobulin light chain junction region [Mus musculus]NSL98408.1 immunoglobulin light chain junction region [Mus musculus]NSL98419.1 immunoglobulin light chain junction region [Mus musculus]NSL99665.1 immunoglobulin light chain junction region [Mus musculus]